MAEVKQNVNRSRRTVAPVTVRRSAGLPAGCRRASRTPCGNDNDPATTIPGLRYHKPRMPVSKPSVMMNFLEALLAIILGNLVYFALVPHLPPAARHHRFQPDLGTLVDFWFCVVAYGLIRSARRWR